MLRTEIKEGPVIIIESVILFCREPLFLLRFFKKRNFCF